MFKKPKKYNSIGVFKNLKEYNERLVYDPAIYNKKSEASRIDCISNARVISRSLYVSNNHSFAGVNTNIFVSQGSPNKRINSLIIPNMIQTHGSYVIFDTNLAMYSDTLSIMKNCGYKIKVLDLKNLNYDRYNPFMYIRDEMDIIRFVNVLVGLLKENYEYNTFDPFLLPADEYLLIMAMSYIYNKYPKEERNLPAVVDLLLDEEFDCIMRNYATKNPDSLIYIYKKRLELLPNLCTRDVIFRLAKALECLKTMSASLNFGSDTIDLYSIFDGNTVVMVIMDDTNSNMSFMANLFFYQMMGIAYETIDKNPISRLDHHLNIIVNCIPCFKHELDKLEGLIAVSRGRNMSFIIGVDNYSTFKNKYQGHANISGCCDIMISYGYPKENLIPFKTLYELIGDKFKPAAKYQMIDKSYIFIRGFEPIIDESL